MFQGRKAESNNGWEGSGPWPYTILEEPDLTHHIERLAFHSTQGSVDCVTFQPYPDPDKNQDRHVVKEWVLEGQVWKIYSIFDGHAGHDAVNYTAEYLPALIFEKLSDILKVTGGGILPSRVIELLQGTISAFDDQMTEGVVSLFPGGVEAIAKMTDDEIRAIATVDGKPHLDIKRCMSGTTVLIALVDPVRNLYVASVGDCQAVLGVKDDTGEWETSILSANHNGRDLEEVLRLKVEHPDEDQVVLDDRVLGGIAVTRAIGDQVYKLPAEYTKRIFTIADPSAYILTRVTDVLPRNLTPPYLSNVPDVRYVDLKRYEDREAILILASDGLVDLYDAYDSELLKKATDNWVKIVAEGGDKPSLRLLRSAMGGDNLEKVSFWITAEMQGAWMDDTTIVTIRNI